MECVPPSYMTVGAAAADCVFVRIPKGMRFAPDRRTHASIPYPMRLASKARHRKNPVSSREIPSRDGTESQIQIPRYHSHCCQAAAYHSRRVCVNCLPQITAGPRRRLLSQISAPLLRGQYTKLRMLPRTVRQLSEIPQSLLFPLHGI